MKVRIKKCKSKFKWYRRSIGEVFNVSKVDKEHYWVYDYFGTISMIDKEDASEDWDKKIVRVISCSNPVMWYNGHEASIFEVSHEDDNAYWVYNKPNAAVPISFIYKKDCEVLE